jgi:hypothetical protein
LPLWVALSFPLEPELELELSPINETRLLFCGNTKKGGSGSINTACAALFLFTGTGDLGGEPELEAELAPLPGPELAPKPNPEAMLEAKRELEPEPDTEPETEEPDPAIGFTPTKNGASGSINTACAALLDFWDGGGRGTSEGVGVWFIVLGVGVLLFEEEERSVLCEELERNGCDELGGNGWEEGLEGNDCGEGVERDGW